MNKRSSNRPARLTVRQTADQLGISEDAVRSRIKRGTLRAVKESGVVVVLLDADQQTTSQTTDEATGQADRSSIPPYEGRDELIEELRDRVRSLEESNRENRRIIAGLVQRVPELEASSFSPGESSTWEPPSESQSSREASDTAGEGDGRETPAEAHTEAHSAAGGSENQQEEPKRAWWRRIFGG